MCTTMEVDELDYLLPANCPNPYFDTWDRHNSIAFSTATKGLRNAPGENNCFVNSAVQVFWHLDVFRRSYRRLSGHTCMGNSCIFCALKVIFTQFQFSDQSSLHPDALRKALAETFANQQRFQLGHMDDAAECFENILRRIHFHIANTCNEDTCTAPHCLPHQKFSLNIVEKVVCPCGASSNPLKFSEMVHYISAKALVSQARLMQETGDILHPDRFGLLLRNANAMGDIRDCPGACGKTVQIRRTLLNSPDVVSIGLVWDSDHPSVEMTTEVACTIGTTILMQDVFHSVMQDLQTLPKLQLVGLVCYYGKHYSTFVFHSKLQVWIYFDDATVREIGPRWEHVVDKCSKGRYQPLLLLYANPNANPVPVDTAPKKRTMAPGYGVPGGPEEESSLDRTHESISSQRSFQRSQTPNPEPSQQQPDQTTINPRARSVTPSTAEETTSSVKSFDHKRQQSFIMAMSPNQENKAKHPLRFGGQAAVGGMMSGSDLHDNIHHTHHGSQTSSNGGEENYSDYTLSTSDQYRRPGLGGFEPVKLPLTPNMKGYVESQRKDSFRKGKEQIRADVVRYQVDSARPQSTMSPTEHYQSQGQGYSHPGQGYDPNQPPSLPPKSAKPGMFYQGTGQSHIRQRTLSQGGDEAYGSDSSSYDGQPQHSVIKPKASSHNYDNIDGLSQCHTPVQSGLATLPRKKKELSKDLSGHQRHISAMSQEGVTSFSRQGSMGNLSTMQDPRASPKLEGLPPPIPVKHPNLTVIDDVVEGNANTGSSSSSKKLTDSDKKAKKLKKELKKAEKKRAKHGDGSASSKPPLHPSSSVGSAGSSDNSVRRPEEYRDEKVVYIDRRKVEAILKHQGLQRQPSTNSNASHGSSSSSIESDSIMGRLLAAKYGEGGLPTDISFDNVSLGSHKDSGYGSSDRNSSSSTGSGTIDPCTQYFISKSMVVPRNFNPQFMQQPPHHLVSDFTAPNPQVYTASMGQSEGQGKDLSGLSREEMTRHLYETLAQRNVMHPIKESSQEDILKIIPKEQTPTSTPVRGPSPSAMSDGLGKEGRPPPIPPKNFAAFQVSKSSHQREPSIDSLDTDEVKNDYFLSMCEKADEFMDMCVLAETEEDLTSAVHYCDNALGCLKEAMNQTDISNKALVYAQKKHNSCLLKSRSLFKRTSSYGSSDGSTHGGKRSSITSTDSDNSDKPLGRGSSKERLLAPGRGAARLGQQPPPAPSAQYASQSPSQGHHQQQDSTNSSSRRSQLPVSQHPTTSLSQQYPPSSSVQQHPSSSSSSYGLANPAGGHPRSHMSRPPISDRADPETAAHARSSSNSSLRSSASVPSSMSCAGAQPQTSLHKSHSSSGNMATSTSSSSTPMPLDAYGTLPRNRKARRTSDPAGNSEVYQMYLNRQKNLQNNSGSDSRESDSSSCEGNNQKKISKAEIRELLENNVVQRNLQQFGTGLQVPKSSDTVAVDPRAQGMDPRLQLGQRNSYDGAGQRSSLASNGSGGGGNSYPVPQLQPNVSSTDRLSHPTQGSNISASSDRDLQQQGSQASVSSSSVQGPPHLRSSPHPSSGSVHPSPSYHNQQSQSSGPYLSQPMPGQSRQASAYQPQYQHPTHLAQQPTQGQYPQTVSGYSQPLPGHRVPPSSSSSLSLVSQQNSRLNRNADTSSSPAQPPSSQSYSPIYTQVPGMPQSRTLSQAPLSDSQTHQNVSEQDSSQNYSNTVSSSVNTSNGGSITQNRTSHPGSVQALAKGVQNLGLGRRNSGGPPPPPPARTTSNPDFRQQQQPPCQPHQRMYNQQPGASPEVGYYSQQRGVNIARVPPNSHLDHQQIMAASDPPPNRHASTHINSSDFSLNQGSQLKHATSSTALNYLTMAPRPLERCASQPDCQNLVDSASYSCRTDYLPPYYASSNQMSSSTNDKSKAVHGNGINGSLQQNFDSYVAARQDRHEPDSLAGDDEPLTGPNVRDLASRFDNKSDKPTVKPKPSFLGQSRNRSKSESGSKKPKSVLKSKKNKSNKMPRKSVTFAENISNLGYESAAELTSFSSTAHMNDRAYFSDDEDHFVAKPTAYSDNELDDVEDSSNSDDSPLPREELACQLCRKREIEQGKAYCSKCSFYMGRLVSS